MNLDVIINPQPSRLMPSELRVDDHHYLSASILPFVHRGDYRFGSNMMGNDHKGEDMKRKHAPLLFHRGVCREPRLFVSAPRLLFLTRSRAFGHNLDLRCRAAPNMLRSISVSFHSAM